MIWMEENNDGTVVIHGLAGFFPGQIIGNQFKNKKEFNVKGYGEFFKYSNPLYGVEKLEVIECVKDLKRLRPHHDEHIVMNITYSVVKPLK